MKQYRIPLMIFLVLAVMLLLYPRHMGFRYHYQTGRPWNYEALTADFDFPILKTESQLRAERDQKSSSVLDYYRQDPSVSEQVQRSVAAVLPDSIKYQAERSLRTIYSKGVVSYLNSKSETILVKRDKRVLQYPAGEVYLPSDAAEKLLSDISGRYPDFNVDSLSDAVKLTSLILPNLSYDAEATATLAREAYNYISPTSGMVYSGQQIVGSGEVVTAEIAQMIDSYKAEYISAYGGQGTSGLRAHLSHILTVIFLFLAYTFAIYMTDRTIFQSFRRYSFLMMLYLLVYLGVVVFSAENERIMYLIPFSLFVLYTMEFFRNEVCFPLYMTALLPLLLLRDSGVELYMMNLMAGGVLLLSYKRFDRGWAQFLNSFFIFVSLALVYVTFRLSGGAAISHRALIFLLLNSLLAVIGHPFIYLFERIFQLVSQMRLWELSDTNNPLLLELSRKAPGSFQHSLQVANLAESASRALKCNTRLVRCGALYHDIGKMLNPVCFTENQGGVNEYHSSLTPAQSAHDVIKHVEDGLRLAGEHHLPEQVKDMISSHHGTTRTAYFYAQHCNAGGDPADVAPFTYTGKLPVSKEEVVLMCADSVEAASRSLQEYTPESISALVDRIVAGKIADGQIAKADITLGEIDAMKECFKDDLRQIYHTRIAYPPQKNE